MDSLKSDSNPLAKVPATVDVATVDPSVDMVLPTSGTPLLATISGGSFSASPKESDQPISTVTTSNAWSKPLSITQPSSAATVLMQTSKELIADLSRETRWPSPQPTVLHLGVVNLLLGQSTLQGLLRIIATPRV
ncbi:unnamed protein product [Brassica napus]|uniref:(rape) hypothetical protein n=1 Tax=Brassica napus TaxID=3708 RepID=A0A816XW59_BRANA|nr:unnamed protein product [Brassica napus]